LDETTGNFKDFFEISLVLGTFEIVLHTFWNKNGGLHFVWFYGTLTYFCLYCRFVLVIWILMWQRRSLSKPLCNLEILCRSKFMRAKDMVMFNLEL